MKKLNLDQTWKLCLSMWRWIAKQIREGSKVSVNLLKSQWLEKHGYEAYEIMDDCFFCESGDKKAGCDPCPGKKVDIEFDCSDSAYNWFSNPVVFYNKLVSLNRERLAKKGKRRKP